MASIALRGPQHLAPEVVPGASLLSEALSPECGRECQKTGDCGPARHVGAGRWRTIGADCSRVARATTPGPPPQPHGWVRLGLEVSRFPHFWVGGLACAGFPRGVEFQGSLAPFFLHILKQQKKGRVNDLSLARFPWQLIYITVF